MADAAYHCEQAWLGGDQAEADVTVTVRDDRIAAVSVGEPAPDGAVHLAGLTLPGLANAHSHAFHRALRGRTQAGTGTFWTWRDQMYDLARRLDPDTLFRLARATYAEMALAGITSVTEFHYLHHRPDGAPYDDPNAMGAAVLAAADEAGIRITLLDTCYLHGGLDRFRDRDAEGWATRAEALLPLASERAEIGAAVHSVRAVDPDAIAVLATWTGDRALPLHAHVSEQPAENEQCLAAHGRTPTRLLADQGALGGRFTAVHAIHLTGEDVSLLGGSTVCLCPTTERDLADGIAPAGALMAAGARLSLGSDSHAVIDLLEEARAVELDERLATGRRGAHDAPSLLRAATGHGRIEVGAPADLVSIRVDSVRTAGAGDHALETAVFAATAADVHHVVAGGRTVVAEHRHATLDVAAELEAAVRAVHP
jgi:formiminoglutamate deiminase